MLVVLFGALASFVFVLVVLLSRRARPPEGLGAVSEARTATPHPLSWWVIAVLLILLWIAAVIVLSLSCLPFGAGACSSAFNIAEWVVMLVLLWTLVGWMPALAAVALSIRGALRLRRTRRMRA